MKASKVIYKDENRIKVEFPFAPEIVVKLKQVPDAKWSQTLKAWHVPYTKDVFELLIKIFPEIEYEGKHVLEKDKTVPKISEKMSEPAGVLSGKRKDVYILVSGRSITVKLPKNDTDTHFILSFRYSRWDKNKYCWIVPNFSENLNLLKDYFAERIAELCIQEEVEINTSQSEVRTIGKDELLLIKTKAGRLKLFFGLNPALIKLVKSMPYHTWNKQTKCWTIPFSERYVNEIRAMASAEKLHVIYEIEEIDPTKVSRRSAKGDKNYRRCPEEYILKIRELRYSERTIKTYSYMFEEFINYYDEVELDKIDEAMITKFLSYLVIERKVSSSYQNQAINAIKFYFEKVLKGIRKIYLVDRPKKEKSLPDVISEEAVISLFKAVDNLKHKTILLLAYSAGLRLGELINLKIKDIDSKRMQIRVEQGKGKKDRYTLLSPYFLEILRDYYIKCQPKEWLFEGATGGKYSGRSIQMIVQRAAKKARINKRVTVHTLRHSFATHLLENGTDMRYIQSLLGHASIKTTEIYTHVTTKGFDQIKSPLDKLDLK